MTDVVRYGTVAGFAAAAAEANRRRRSSAGAAAAAVAVVVAVGGSSGLHGGEPAGLVPASPGVTAPATPREAGGQQRAPRAAAPPPAGSHGTVGKRGPGPERPAPPPPGAPHAAAGRRPAADLRTGPRPAASLPVEPAPAADSFCVPNGTSSLEACAATQPPSVSAKGVRLTVTYCAGVVDRVLRFAEDAEVEFRVAGKQRPPVWDSIRERPPVAAPHERWVPAGSCVAWTQVWLRRTNAGAAVPPGRYTLHPRIRAEGAPLVAPVAFDLP